MRGHRKAVYVGHFDDWSSGPPSAVVLSCGHVREYRPPSPASGDRITCGCCGAAAIVVRPIRRTDRHGPRYSDEELIAVG